MFMAEKQATVPTTQYPTIRKMTDSASILVMVEDDAINMMLISEVLRKMGFNVLQAFQRQTGSGNAATDRYAVFMDVNVRNGWLCHHALSVSYPNHIAICRSFALTADAMQGIKKNVLRQA